MAGVWRQDGLDASLRWHDSKIPEISTFSL